MKIVLTANTAWNIVNFRAPLLKRLVDAGHEVIVAGPADEAVARLEALGIRHVPIPMDQKAMAPHKDTMVIGRYWRLFRRERPDVVFGFTIKANIYGAFAARASRVPFIPNISGLGTAFLGSGLIEGLVSGLYRAAFRNLPIVFFQNADDLALFREKGIVSPRQARLIPGSGVDLKHFKPGGGNHRKGRRETIFLLVARLLRDKGVGEFVEAAGMVRAKHPDARFQLLGQPDAPNRTAIRRETVEKWVKAGIVEHLGAVDDVRPHIENADCVVLPSYREGAPRSLIEAAAMAKPLIATDVPGCREVVMDGTNGFMCEVRSASSLAASIERFLALDENERREMRRQSRNLAEKKFDVGLVNDAYERALNDICSGAERSDFNKI